MKLRLYWNEKYPDSIYFLAHDVINNEPVLYVLIDEEDSDVSPEERLNAPYWYRTNWNARSEKSLKGQGFELMGEL